MSAWAVAGQLTIAVFLSLATASAAEQRSAAGIEPASHLHRIDEIIPEARQSYYSDRLFRLLKQWPPVDIPDISTAASPIWMRGVRTPGQPDYIGVERRIRIDAPLDRVTAMIEGFEHYPEFFSTLRQVRVTARDGNKLTVEWERDPPVIFAPTVVYQTVYLIDRTNPNRVAYRYQLKSGSSMHFSDGIIVVEKLAPERTLLTAFDFFDADFGFLRAIAGSVIWRRSLESSYLGDAAFKLKAEHPDWTYHKIEEASHQLLNQFPMKALAFADGLPSEAPSRQPSHHRRATLSARKK